MTQNQSSPPSWIVLVADDDADDRLMIRDAVAESQIRASLQFVEDGEELIDYLLRRGKFAAAAQSPRPDLILLDLNMPKKDGRQALREIKNHPALRGIPVVALTTSQLDTDIQNTYDLGVNSFITKPVSFDALVQIIKDLGHYWLHVVKLPHQERGN